MIRRVAMATVLTALVGCISHLTAPREYVLFFPINDATVTPEAQDVVAQIASAARDARPSKIVIEGQADGGTAHDATLADERADTVLHALVSAGTNASSVDKRPSAPAPEITGVAAHKVKVTLFP
jgi:hypothetical protein